MEQVSLTITRDELRHAIYLQLKTYGLEDGLGLTLLTDLFNSIYRTGKIKSDSWSEGEDP